MAPTHRPRPPHTPGRHQLRIDESLSVNVNFSGLSSNSKHTQLVWADSSEEKISKVKNRSQESGEGIGILGTRIPLVRDTASGAGLSVP